MRILIMKRRRGSGSHSGNYSCHIADFDIEKYVPLNMYPYIRSLCSRGPACAHPPRQQDEYKIEKADIFREIGKPLHLQCVSVKNPAGDTIAPRLCTFCVREYNRRFGFHNQPPDQKRQEKELKRLREWTS